MRAFRFAALGLVQSQPPLLLTKGEPKGEESRKKARKRERESARKRMREIYMAERGPREDMRNGARGEKRESEGKNVAVVREIYIMF